jgi:non-ribosomal peptide synthetase component F
MPACPENPSEHIPVGSASDGEEILVINDEIHIGGVGLSPGYWRNPVKTAAAFLPHPHRPVGASTAPAILSACAPTDWSS